MMWILTPLQPGGQTSYLLAGKDYVVGRKNCDVLLSKDQSISRAHAVLTATEQTLTVKDTSKYGTSVNNQRLVENTLQELRPGDSVTFGVFESKFRVDCQEFVVCSSCLDNDAKSALSKVLGPFGGKLVNNWTQDCTHLVMPSVKVTIKTISALLCCRPIVKPDFFSELGKAIQQKLPFPNADRFIPEIDEPSLNKTEVNLRAIPTRRQLFSEKTFLFLSAKQLKRLSAAVSHGGGRSQLLEEGSLPRNLLESAKSCVVDIVSGSSQPLLSSTTTEWAHSVKNILQRKGLRVIPESEIGLAAIYASCEKYCNPSDVMTDTGTAQNVRPRIPSASLSQTSAVEETVLAATSQNITAYAPNTEQSQGTELPEVTGMTTVGETPEKRQRGISSQLSQHTHDAQKYTNPCVVASTASSSRNTEENTGSQWKKPKTKLSVSEGTNGNIRSQPPFSQHSGGMKTSPTKHSPQKQQTLTSFFQPVAKKRPLEDEDSDVQSKAKRAIMADNAPAARAQSPLVSDDDLFAESSDVEVTAGAAKDKTPSRKRKEMDAEIEMEELESIMSLDMDCMDEPNSTCQSQDAQMKDESSAEQKTKLTITDLLCARKKQRLHSEESSRNNPRPQMDLPQASVSRSIQNYKPPESVPSSDDIQRLRPLKKEKESFFERSTDVDAEILPAEDKTETLLQPVTVKQEHRVSEINEDLPKKLVLVEVRSLTMTAAPKAKAQEIMWNNSTKNFKRFRKVQVLGTEESLHIIGGTDLLAHSKDKNSDLGEWLKNAAEEEQQSRRDESIGDDLFRYNPSKLSRRR